MSANTNFDETMARWELSDRILRSVLKKAKKLDENTRPADKITVTAPVNLLNEFHIYRQPEGAAKARHTRVVWESANLIRVFRPANTAGTEGVKEFKVRTEGNGSKTLVDGSCDDLADYSLDGI
jgi:hypothetical protein